MDSLSVFKKNTFLGLLGFSCTVALLLKADDHAHSYDSVLNLNDLLTGQGDLTFSWDQELSIAFPEEAKRFEPKMHGGFTEDPDTNIVYTGISGYGFCSISADLKTWKKLGEDPRLKENIHGLVLFAHKGNKYIALAQNKKERVLVVDLKGDVVGEIYSPVGDEFDFEPANDYYSGKAPLFAVTDVTYLNGRLFAVTGYSPGDFVLTAEERNGHWHWGKLAWGGKGNGPTQFKTAHGIFAYKNHIYVASRGACQVKKFTADGELVEILKDIPDKSKVCNVAHSDDHFYICPLTKVMKEQRSAPVYAHTGQTLASTIIPGELNIPNLDRIHHVWPHYITKADGSRHLYLLVQGWSQGKYAVLKHKSIMSNKRNK